MIAAPVRPPEPLSYRPRDAARMLGVSARTLYEWTRSGRVHCVRIGTGKRAAVLYPVDSLRRLLAEPLSLATDRTMSSPVAPHANQTRILNPNN
jgi:excisionase family DNA binding protein